MRMGLSRERRAAAPQSLKPESKIAMSISTRSVDPPTTDVPELPELTKPELLRYARHIVMPEVGLDGQKKLKAARVVRIGAGGLGSPLGLYLAAAGVGTLGVVDFDVVDESNLQRQVLHGTSDVGRPKLDSAADRMREVNPHVLQTRAAQLSVALGLSLRREREARA